MRKLLFVEPNEEAFLAATTTALRGGARRLRFPRSDEISQRLASRAKEADPQVVIEPNVEPLSGYLDVLSAEERLLRLVDDRWLLGSIRDRMAKFAAWLDFGNVIPVSFEELVGPQGGSDEAVQHDLIWSLMLRLHVPGDPAHFAGKVFNPNSPTFRSGRIGGHERHFTPAAWAKFKALDQDFIEVFGYGAKPAAGPWLSSRAAEFRRRRPRYSRASQANIVYLVRQDFLGFHIFHYKERFVAMPPNFPYSDLASAPEEVIAQLPTGKNLAAVEFLVQSRIMLEYLGKNRA
jgi:hypothetical protein